MKRKLTVILLVSLLLFNYGQCLTVQQVSASIKSGEMITLTQPGQVIDTIEYNGVTIEAVYTNESYAKNDKTYCCAAFIKKFYQLVYGITVYNLNSPSSEPLIYDNKGSFTITDNPQKGDIVRDNTRTHWAIVKEVSGNTIAIIQQSYRSGTKAWINCTIDKTDTGFSYFTYSNRIPDVTQNGVEGNIGDGTAPNAIITGNGEISNTTPTGDGAVNASSPNGDGVITNNTNVGNGTAPAVAINIEGASSLPTGLPGDTTAASAIAANSASSAAAAQINNGTYLLIQGTGIAFVEAAQKESDWQIHTAQYSGLEGQKLSIVNTGNNQYSLQFLSDQRFVSVSETMQIKSTDTLEQKFVFVQRANGYYTLSLAENPNKVVVVDQQSKDNCGVLVVKDYSGAMNELWCLNMVTEMTLPIQPKVTVSKKTLYAGSQDYKIKVKQLLESAVVSYTTSNPEIASVSTDGSIHPISIGKAIITVEVKQENNTYTEQIAVTVKVLNDKMKASKKK